MFRRARGTIREVEPEVISPADQTPWVVQLLAAGQLPHVGIESPPPSETELAAPRQEALHSVEVDQPEEIELELAPLIEIDAAVPREQPLPQVEVEVEVEVEQPEERPAPKLEPPKAKRPRAKHSRPAERAASPAPVPAVEESIASEPKVPVHDDDLTCEILFWRGYRKATFYARIFSDEGEPLAVAQSPSFRAQGNGTPDKTEEAVAAYRALREQLELAGWEHAGSGRAWFTEVYSRPL